LFGFSYNYLQTLLSLRKDIVIALSNTGKLALARKQLKILTNHVRTYGKYFRRLEQLNPSHFVELPRCGDLVLYYWQQVVEATGGPADMVAGMFKSGQNKLVLMYLMQILDTNEAPYPIRFLVQGMVLFKDSLSQWSPKRRDGTENPQSM
jgi:hypothetical protein